MMCLVLLMASMTAMGKKKAKVVELWPDGTEIPAWFSDTSRVDVSGLKRYVVTDYGVDSWADGVQTKELQAVIDRCAAEGGGVVVIPRGTFLSGSLFFKPKTHLLIEEGGPDSEDAHGGTDTELFRGPGECRRRGRIYDYRSRHHQWQRTEILGRVLDSQEI